MSISRTGECPIYLKYITEQALVPKARQPNPDFIALTRYNFHWIDVPSFQRGLVWDEELLENLLGSRSVFLGNAILGSFLVPRGSPAFAYLPVGVAQYEVLIDGLQRFSIGTALLSILFPLVLSDTPERGDDAGFFAPLKLQATNWGPVYQHNDFELRNHIRKAVADSYSAFRGQLQIWVTARFERGEASVLAEQVIQLFLQRQIAPDIYHGFSSVYEVANTFIGLNTVRVQLGTVDWLRSVVIEKGGEAQWAAEDIEALENRFSEIFNRDSGTGPDQELVPLASIVKDVLTEGTQDEKMRVFPSWGPGFQLAEAFAFLKFVEAVVEHDSNPFVREIRLCGAIPFAALILYFYRRKLLEYYEPAFLEGGDQDDRSLIEFLRACYRVVFEGKVAKTKDYAKRLLLTDVTLNKSADYLSRVFLGKSLADPVDRDWLVTTLKFGDQKRARQIFNACLLPERDTGTAFHPHRYGRTSDDYQIDHMIPASVIDPHLPGGPEGHLMMNFAPIRRTTNIKQLNIQCSQKLTHGGVYQIECLNNDSTHPYLRWLVETQGAHGSQLDLQELLQPAAKPEICADRIHWLADRLIDRL